MKFSAKFLYFMNNARITFGAYIRVFVIRIYVSSKLFSARETRMIEEIYNII